MSAPSLSASPSNSPQAAPTYATPRTPSRYTDGPLYAHVIAQKLNRVLTPWQQYALDLATERLDGPGSPFAYDQIVIIVGRRSGKTVTALGCSLVRALNGAVRLPNGRRMPFLAAHTAQNLIQARKRFIADLVEPYQASVGADNWRPAHNMFRNLANTTLSIDPFGRDYRHAFTSQIQVYAPTKSSVRGDGLLHLTLDEALVFSADDGAALMSAARPAMAEYGGHAQLWITSNISADTDESRWITSLRDRGREAVRIGRRLGFAYIEFSMPPDGDPADEALWWAHLPALSDGLVGITELRRDFEELGPARFGAEYLGLWPGSSAVRAWAGIPRTVWQAAQTGTEAPEDGTYHLGVDIDPFGRAATLVAVTSTPEGAPIIDVVAHGDGSAWVAEAVRRHAGKAASVTVDDYGPGRDLLMTLDGAPGLIMSAVTTRDVAAACYAFEQAIGARTVMHRGDEHLNAAVGGSLRTPGRSWVYERRLDTVQTPLMAAVLALWGHHHGGPAVVAEPQIF
jgi:hypothetical protein